MAAHLYSLQIPPLFRLIKRLGGLSYKEMYMIFNMGIGMVIFCENEKAKYLTVKIPNSKVIGEVVKQRGKEQIFIDDILGGIDESNY